MRWLPLALFLLVGCVEEQPFVADPDALSSVEGRYVQGDDEGPTEAGNTVVSYTFDGEGGGMFMVETPEEVDGESVTVEISTDGLLRATHEDGYVFEAIVMDDGAKLAEDDQMGRFAFHREESPSERQTEPTETP